MFLLGLKNTPGAWIILLIGKIIISKITNVKCTITGGSAGIGCQLKVITPRINSFTMMMSVCDTHFIIKPLIAIIINNNKIK